MQVIDLCAAVLFFVMLALGVGNYNSSWVLSLFPKKLTHQAPMRRKALLGTLEIQSEMHAWLYHLKRTRERKIRGRQ